MSVKIMAVSFWWLLISSMMRLRACEDVDSRGLNPFWFWLRSSLAQGELC